MLFQSPGVSTGRVDSIVSTPSLCAEARTGIVIALSEFTTKHQPFDKGARESDPGAYAVSQLLLPHQNDQQLCTP